MPKLIRILGDSEQNSTEIKNTFRQPIIIKPYSKVALVGASVFLTDELVNESFTVTSTSSDFKIGVAPVPLNASITPGQYSANELIEQFQIAANYTGVSGEAPQAPELTGLGLHHVADIVDNKLSLTTHRAVFEAAGLNDTNKWEVLTGSTTVLTSTSITAGAQGCEINTSTVQACIPMVKNRFEAVMNDCSGKQVDIFAFQPHLGTVWGVRVLGNTYYKWNDLSTNWVSTGATWQAQDEVKMETYAGHYVLNIDTSAGVSKLAVDDADAIPREAYGKLADANFRWFMDLDANAVLTSVTTTNLFNVPENQLTIGDNSTTAQLQFKDAADETNMLLAIYMGFGQTGGAPIVYSGNPANLQGRQEIAGLAAYPSIIVTLDGLGPLESYDGAATSQAPDNIIYVLNDLRVITGNQLQLDIPSPFFLDMNNAHPINVNQLRARFLPTTGQKINSSLSFSGKPSLTLLIDG